MKTIITLILFLTFFYNTIPQNKQENSSHNTDTGYCNFTSFGYLIGSGGDEQTFASSLSMEHNYKFNKNFALGLYTGIDWLDYAVAPIGVSTKLFLPLKNKTFFTGGAIGSSIALEDKKMENYEISDTKGGRFVHLEIGLTFANNSKFAFFVAAGYKLQQLSYIREDWFFKEVDRTMTYNRFVIKIGVRI